MDFKYLSGKRTASAQEIAALRERWINIPEDYVTYLRDTGSGRISANHVEYPPSLVEMINVTKIHSVDEICDHHAPWVGFTPPGFIAVAASDGGPFIMMSVRAEDKGGIYFWDPQFSLDDDEVPTMEAMTFIGPSFNEFISSLRAGVFEPISSPQGGIKRWFKRR